VAPQRRRHDAKGIEQPSAHAQETDVQCKTQLQCVTATRVDHIPLNVAESEEGLQLEAADLSRQRDASPGTSCASPASRTSAGGR